jgi:hypothetical protein
MRNRRSGRPKSFAEGRFLYKLKPVIRLMEAEGAQVDEALLVLIGEGRKAPKYTHLCRYPRKDAGTAGRPPFDQERLKWRT